MFAEPDASAFIEARRMVYVLPRIIIFAIAWGISCVLISAVRPAAGFFDFCFAAVSWASTGYVYVIYMRKLRRQRQDLRLARSALPPGLLAEEPRRSHETFPPRDLDVAA
jgi:hypothetical protein